MGRRNKFSLNARKIIGLILAVVGAYILIDMVPSYLWWMFLGFGLLVSGWLLFNS